MVLWLVLLGLALGSFSNAAIWRLHERQKQQGKEPRKAKKQVTRNLSIVTGRSMCSSCGHQLAAKDLMPVVSYLWLHGKCRYCGKSIEDTPLAELIMPVAFVVSYLLWPYSLSLAGLTLGWVLFVIWLVLLVGFVILALYDLKWMLLPDRVVFPLVGLAVVEVVVRATIFHEGWAALVKAMWGVVLTAGLFYVLHLISKGKWIGFGDVKLAVVLGLIVGGPLPGLLVVFFASLIGSLAAVPLLVQKKPVGSTRIPFGPFLLLATLIVVLVGEHITTWYLGLLAVQSL